MLSNGLWTRERKPAAAGTALTVGLAEYVSHAPPQMNFEPLMLKRPKSAERRWWPDRVHYRRSGNDHEVRGSGPRFAESLASTKDYPGVACKHCQPATALSNGSYFKRPNPAFWPAPENSHLHHGRLT
jgi:hypothetical protein